jgi:hypothetical protein
LKHLESPLIRQQKKRGTKILNLKRSEILRNRKENLKEMIQKILNLKRSEIRNERKRYLAQSKLFLQKRMRKRN